MWWIALACKHDDDRAHHPPSRSSPTTTTIPSTSEVAPDTVVVEGRPLERHTVPLTGGIVAENGAWIGVSDIDEDRVVLFPADPDGWFVDLSQPGDGVRELVLPEGWAPGSVAWDGDGLLQVLLRGPGALAVVDPGGDAGPTLVRQVPVCPDPRGLAVDRATTWVTCAGGELVEVAADGVASTTWLDPDLRDIVVVGDRALVARFRAAEVLVVDLRRREVTARYAAPVPIGGGTPRVARRLVPWGGRAVLAYQVHQNGPLPVAFNPGGISWEHDNCNGYVRQALAVVGPDGFGDPAVLRGGPVVDLLPSGSGAFPDTLSTDGARFQQDPVPDDGCSGDGRWFDAAPLSFAGLVLGAEPTAPAEERTVWGIARWPLVAVALDEDHVVDFEIDVLPSGVSGYFDFPAVGLSCAACHPDGADDGHTWQFETDGNEVPGTPEVVSRRTLPLGGRIADAAPFDWDGGLGSMDDLFEQVGVWRVGLPDVSLRKRDAFADFVNGFAPLPHAGPPPDPAAVTRGETQLRSLGCDGCHAGPRWSSRTSRYVGTGRPFQVPTLLGVGARTPLMHDGCAPTLRDVLIDADCAGDVHAGVVTGADLDDLVAFLGTL